MVKSGKAARKVLPFVWPEVSIEGQLEKWFRGRYPEQSRLSDCSGAAAGFALRAVGGEECYRSRSDRPNDGRDHCEQ
jgi:hypothetical protein